MIWYSLILDWIALFGNDWRNPEKDVTRIKTVIYRSR